MINHTRIWVIGIISAIATLSLTFAITFPQSGSTEKSEQSSGDNNYPEIREKVLQYMEIFEKGHPNVMEDFYSLYQAAMDSAVLDAKTKHLITLGIAVSIGCDGCIAYHTNALLEAGGTEEEIMEVLGVAVYMGGGPSLVYATHAIEALEQFKATEK